LRIEEQRPVFIQSLQPIRGLPAGRRVVGQVAISPGGTGTIQVIGGKGGSPLRF
jgi:hypothetical protein